MRVTTQMINKSAMEAGIPINRHSLLDYVRQSGQNAGVTGTNSLADVYRSRKAKETDAASRTGYEKQGKAARALLTQAKKLEKTGENSLWEKAKADGDTKALVKEAEDLVARYNDLLKEMKSSTGVLDEFYRQGLKDLIGEYQESLESVGVTVAKDGTLKASKEKLSAASAEELEKVFGDGGKLTAKLAFLAGRTADYAEANAERTSGRYLADGSMPEGYRSSWYDFRG